MDSHFKTALDQIKAEESTITQTLAGLKNAQKTKKVPGTARHFFIRRYAAVAALFLVVLLGGASGYAYFKIPTTYLSIDINPSVELGVSKSGRVVIATGINDDGKTVMNGLDVVGLNVQRATQSIVRSASKNNFIQKDGSTVISITPETGSNSKAEELTNAANNGINAALKITDEKVSIYINEKISLDMRSEAQEFGISPGKLNLIRKLQKLNPTVTVAQYQNAKVKDITNAIHSARKNKDNDQRGNTDSKQNNQKSASDDIKKKDSSKQGGVKSQQRERTTGGTVKGKVHKKSKEETHTNKQKNALNTSAPPRTKQKKESGKSTDKQARQVGQSDKD